MSPKSDKFRNKDGNFNNSQTLLVLLFDLNFALSKRSKTSEKVGAFKSKPLRKTW